MTSKMIVTRVGADTKKAGINRLFLCGRGDNYRTFVYEAKRFLEFIYWYNSNDDTEEVKEK